MCLTVPIENHRGKYLCHPILDAKGCTSAPAASPEQSWKKARMPCKKRGRNARHLRDTASKGTAFSGNLFTKKRQFSVSFACRNLCQPTKGTANPLLPPSLPTRTHGHLLYVLLIHSFSTFCLTPFEPYLPSPLCVETKHREGAISSLPAERKGAESALQVFLPLF